MTLVLFKINANESIKNSFQRKVNDDVSGEDDDINKSVTLYDKKTK
jgi:hypothetical protein